MSNTTDEIEQLKKQDLLIAKRLGEVLCTIAYNTYRLFLKGEERESYTELWKKKLVDIKKEIRDSQTPDKALLVGIKFHDELVRYTSATEVATADKAMEIAHTFIKKHSPVALPLKAEREKDVWLVDIDVGALAVKIAKVKVDAKTGDIISYDIPEKK